MKIDVAKSYFFILNFSHLNLFSITLFSAIRIDEDFKTCSIFLYFISIFVELYKYISSFIFKANSLFKA